MTNKEIIKELEEKTQMPVNSILANLYWLQHDYQDDFTRNDLVAINMAIEYIMKSLDIEQIIC